MKDKNIKNDCIVLISRAKSDSSHKQNRFLQNCFSETPCQIHKDMLKISKVHIILPKTQFLCGLKLQLPM